VPNLTATIDTSVLVSLQSADLLGAVSVLFNRLLVPAKVREELKKGGERNRNALKAIEDFAIFEHCNDYDPAWSNSYCRHVNISRREKMKTKQKPSSRLLSAQPKWS